MEKRHTGTWVADVASVVFKLRAGVPCQKITIDISI